MLVASGPLGGGGATAGRRHRVLSIERRRERCARWYARCVVARRQPPVALSRSSLKVKSRPSARETVDGQPGTREDPTALRDGPNRPVVDSRKIDAVSDGAERFICRLLTRRFSSQCLVCPTDRNSAFRYQRRDKAKNPRKAACSRGRRDDASLRLATSTSRRSRYPRHISARASGASASSAPTEHRGIRGGSATSGSVWRLAFARSVRGEKALLGTKTRARDAR